jgi:MFS family permease
MPLWAFAYVWPGMLAAVLVGAVIGYAGLIFFDVMWGTAIQDNVPHHLLARVDSWDMLTSFLAMPLGSALAGPLAQVFGMKPVLAGCAVVLFLAGLTPLAVRSSRELTRPSGLAAPGLGLGQVEEVAQGRDHQDDRQPDDGEQRNESGVRTGRGVDSHLVGE